MSRYQVARLRTKTTARVARPKAYQGSVRGADLRAADVSSDSIVVIADRSPSRTIGCP
jgi:hypothetical protein